MFNKKLKNQISDLIVENFKLQKRLDLIQEVINSGTVEEIEEIRGLI